MTKLLHHHAVIYTGTPHADGAYHVIRDDLPANYGADPDRDREYHIPRGQDYALVAVKETN